MGAELGEVLPHDDAVERAILGAVLINPPAFPAVRGILSPGDFFSKRNGRIFEVLTVLADAGIDPDVLALKSELQRRGELEQVGGGAFLGVLTEGMPKTTGVEYWARQVRSLAVRRDLIDLGARIQRDAGDGVPDPDLTARVEGWRDRLDQVLTRTPSTVPWTASTLEGVVTPEAGSVRYLIEGFIPANEVTMWIAAWKTAKTLLAYMLALEAVSGRPVFGIYRVAEALRVLILQLEMPPSEDDRRFRRLALGLGMYPEEVPGYVQAGALILYNRVPLYLRDDRAVHLLRQLVDLHRPNLIIIDSVLAAFAGADLNDNSVVRDLFARAFNPVLAAGRAVLLLHHKRKRPSGARDGEDDRQALLGAQAWGAAAGRVYALERLADHDDNRSDSSFKVRLSLTGSWTPEQTRDQILEIRDTDEGGTTVRALREAEQLERGGVTTAQKAALALTQIVRSRCRVRRRDAIAEVMADLNLSEPTVKRGLELARLKRWISVEKATEGSHKERDLIPGEEA
jgi:hypothetical protein